MLVDLLFTSALTFGTSEESIALIHQWISEGKVWNTVGGKKVELSIKISPEQRNQMLIKVSSSREIATDVKLALVEKTLKDDKTELAEYCKLSCNAALPDADNKAVLWMKIIDPESKYSLYEMAAITRCLFPGNQADLQEPFIEKFFEVIQSVFELKAKAFSMRYYIFLSPAKFANKDIFEKFKAYAKENKDGRKDLQNKISDDIENMEAYFKGQALYKKL